MPTQPTAAVAGVRDNVRDLVDVVEQEAEELTKRRENL